MRIVISALAVIVLAGCGTPATVPSGMAATQIKAQGGGGMGTPVALTAIQKVEVEKALNAFFKPKGTVIGDVTIRGYEDGPDFFAYVSFTVQGDAKRKGHGIYDFDTRKFTEWQ